MKEVRKGLYIGNFFDMFMVLRDGSAVGEKITHVVSLLSPNFFQPSYEACGAVSPKRSLSDGNLAGKAIAERVVSTPVTGIADCVIERTGLGSQITRMRAPLNDVVTENLLDRLEVCLDFIEKARERGGRVLVHCMAGVSRSASVLVAYLMRTEHLSCQDALASLRKASPTACPNAGFMEQLVMFEQMGCKVDPTHPIYKNFKASRSRNATSTIARQHLA